MEDDAKSGHIAKGLSVVSPQRWDAPVRNHAGAEMALGLLLAMSSVSLNVSSATGAVAEVDTNPVCRDAAVVTSPTRESTPVPTAQVRQRHLVRTGDSLTAMAEYYFGEPLVASLIAELNEHRLKTEPMGGNLVVIVEELTVLTLPDWRELLEFYKRCEGGETTEEVVTIVMENVSNQKSLATSRLAQAVSNSVHCANN